MVAKAREKGIKKRSETEKERRKKIDRWINRE